ncbi:MAG: GntR family transcriptional regulator [Chloroflexota bacterium]
MSDAKILTPISTPNLSDAVYQQLRQLIVDRQYSAGQRLDLKDLEARLQVSRTPLKIALKRLELEGLVDIQARRGTFIAQIDAEQLNDNYKIRSSFELYVALCIFKYLSDDDYQRINQIQNTMNQLVDTCDNNWHDIIDDYIELDQEFHELLVRVGGPPKMLAMFQQTGIHHQLYQVLPHYTLRDFQMMHFEHEQIFSAIQNRSSERLSASLLNHLEAARHRVISILQRL